MVLFSFKCQISSQVNNGELMQHWRASWEILGMEEKEMKMRYETA